VRVRFLNIYIYMCVCVCVCVCVYSVCSRQRQRRLFVRRSVTTDDWVRSQTSPFHVYGKRSGNGICLLPNS